MIYNKDNPINRELLINILSQYSNGLTAAQIQKILQVPVDRRKTISQTLNNLYKDGSIEPIGGLKRGRRPNKWKLVDEFNTDDKKSKKKDGME